MGLYHLLDIFASNYIEGYHLVKDSVIDVTDYNILLLLPCRCQGRYSGYNTSGGRLNVKCSSFSCGQSIYSRITQTILYLVSAVAMTRLTAAPTIR